jgi:hypothetical protein
VSYHFGKIVHVDEATGYAEIQAAAQFGRVSAFEAELRAAGIFPPQLGQSVMFEIGAVSTGVTGAINITAARQP